MKLYKTTFTPLSNFATPLQGDTLFGQLCWVIRYKEGEAKLNLLLSTYETSPFVVISDGFASEYVPKPTMPSQYLLEDADKKKQNRKKIWLTLEELQNGKYTQAKTSEDIGYKEVNASVVKNSINYKTSHTGEGFDPYSEEERIFSSVDTYCLVDESQINIDELYEYLQLVGEMGYGKNASIGKGRFTITSFEEVSLGNTASTTFMGLCNANLHNIQIKMVFYDVLTKFGKHGGDLATKSPFKQPLLLARTGFVVVFEEEKTLQYIGKAIQGHSKHSDVVHQGYSIVIPMKEVEDVFI